LVFLQLRPTICAAPALGSVGVRAASWISIQLLLGHVSIQTTEQYLGSRQRIRSAINDRIGIEPIVTTVHFGVLSMTTNFTCASGGSPFFPENHECGLIKESARRLRELFEHHFRRKD